MAAKKRRTHSGERDRSGQNSAESSSDTDGDSPQARTGAGKKHQSMSQRVFSSGASDSSDSSRAGSRPVTRRPRLAFRSFGHLLSIFILQQPKCSTYFVYHGLFLLC
ncbi:unnamed protein product [Trichobilharzia regenti]|nr:unnamed protein product [Trichobilharzia regenti]